MKRICVFLLALALSPGAAHAQSHYSLPGPVVCGIYNPAQINCNSIPLQRHYQYVGSVRVVANYATNTGTITLSGRVDENPGPVNLIGVDQTGTFTDTDTGKKLTAPTIVTVYFTCTETDGDSCAGPTFLTLHFSYQYCPVGGRKGQCNPGGEGEHSSDGEGQHSSDGVATGCDAAGWCQYLSAGAITIADDGPGK